MKPEIIVIFEKAGTVRWYSVGWENDANLMKTAKKAINDGGTPDEVIKNLEDTSSYEGDRIMTNYLYGHYDSRGGAFLIEADTREEADAKYAEMYGNEDAEWGTKAEQDAQLAEEDFLFDDVKLESYREIADGEDIEYGDPLSYGDPDNVEAKQARAFEDGLSWAAPEVQEITANPFMELLWWHEESKMLRLCDKGVNPGQPAKGSRAANASYSIWPAPEEVPGWRRSKFGEDACGVIVMKKETK